MDDSPLPLVPGDCVGARYVVEELIAAGGMSVVFRARDVRLGQPVAVKVLRDALAPSDAHVSRFLREARTLARLRSDHVVRVLDVDTTWSPPFIVMELLDGEDVAALLRARGPLPVATALRIAIEACRGMVDAHAIGVVHRDLKPSNLLLERTATGEPRVKVIDFGIAKPLVREERAPDLTSSGQILGSPRYMSPEQVRGSAQIDARSDVWAIGAILYELVSGAAPFDAATLADTFARIVADAPPPLRARAPHAPPRLDALVAACLEKDPALRPQSARALLAELEAIAASGSVAIDAPARRATSVTTDTFAPTEPAWVAPPPRRAPPRARRGAIVAGALACASAIAIVAARALAPSAATPAASPPRATSAMPTAASPTRAAAEREAMPPTAPRPPSARAANAPEARETVAPPPTAAAPRPTPRPKSPLRAAATNTTADAGAPLERDLDLDDRR